MDRLACTPIHCRSGDFAHSHDSTVEGIKLYHYIVADHEFYNATTYPPNYGYSAFGKPGVLNLTAVFPQSLLNNTMYVCLLFTVGFCFIDLPVFVSLPHFLGADRSYLDGVIGLKPNKSLHEAFLEVEPVSLTATCTSKHYTCSRQLVLFYMLLKDSSLMCYWKEIRASSKSLSVVLNLLQLFFHCYRQLKNVPPSTMFPWFIATEVSRYNHAVLY